LADSGRTICLPGAPEIEEEEGPMDEVEVSQWLVFKKPEEDGPDIRGGHLDALIVHATKANKNGRCQLFVIKIFSYAELFDLIAYKRRGWNRQVF
jgi:hypothetical protein